LPVRSGEVPEDADADPVSGRPNETWAIRFPAAVDPNEAGALPAPISCHPKMTRRGRRRHDLDPRQWRRHRRNHRGHPGWAHDSGPVPGMEEPLAVRERPVSASPDLTGARGNPVAGDPDMPGRFPVPVTGDPVCVGTRSWPRRLDLYGGWRDLYLYIHGDLGGGYATAHRTDQRCNQQAGCSFHGESTFRCYRRTSALPVDGAPPDSFAARGTPGAQQSKVNASPSRAQGVELPVLAARLDPRAAGRRRKSQSPASPCLIPLPASPA
jgi:hypothetical protein